MTHEPTLAQRQVVALEHLVYELAAIENSVDLIARHFLGGMTADEVALGVEEAKRLRESLRESRKNLSAAIVAAEKTT